MERKKNKDYKIKYIQA